MKRCTRCIMPATVPGITFNEDGVCSHCLSYQNISYLGEKALEDIVNPLRNENNQYDCIVGLSGGRDSTFVLYMAKAVFNLKVLAVSYDNEFRNDHALVNMERACRILGVDFITVRSKRSVAKKLVKNNIRSAHTFGKFGLCGACMYGYTSAVYRAAERYKIPMIFWGESQQEATQEMEQKALTALSFSNSRYKKLLSINFYLAEYYRLLQRLEFPVPGNSALKRTAKAELKNKDIREIRLFDYVKWDRELIKKTITEKLGWERPAGHTSTWRTDCTLHVLVNYCYYKLLGCTKDCFGYAKMINSGQMDREAALQQEDDIIATFPETIKELLEDKIGLSQKETESVLSFKIQ